MVHFWRLYLFFGPSRKRPRRSGEKNPWHVCLLFVVCCLLFVSVSISSFPISPLYVVNQYYIHCKYFNTNYYQSVSLPSLASFSNFFDTLSLNFVIGVFFFSAFTFTSFHFSLPVLKRSGQWNRVPFWTALPAITASMFWCILPVMACKKETLSDAWFQMNLTDPLYLLILLAPHFEKWCRRSFLFRPSDVAL